MTGLARLTGVALVLVLSQTPQFKTGIDVVRFDVVVLDKQRHPVAGLTAEDFRVTEDGKPLRIAGFEAVTIPEGAPAESRAAPDADPGVATVTNHREGPGRIVVIFFDRTIAAERPIATARAVANAAIDALGPNDLAAVVFASGISGKHQQGLTGDRQRLRAAVATAMGTPTLTEMTPNGLSRMGLNLLRGECECDCTLDKLTAVAEALTSLPDYRKMILFIGDTLPVFDDPSQGSGVTCATPLRKRLFKAIDRSSVTVHGFNPRGLDTGALGADAFPTDLKESAEGRMLREGNFASLPDYTGGRAVMNVNDPERLVPAVFDESRTYYVLAVERAPARPDGRMHRVRIDVARPEVSVASRTTYLDASPDTAARATSDPLERALGELLPKADVPLRMTLRSQATKGHSLDVTLATPRTSPGRCDVLIGVFDQFAKQVGSEHARVELPAAGGGADAEWTLHLDPKPGQYEIRAAVRIGDAIGSVTGYVDVAKAPIATAKAEPAAATAAKPRSAALDAILARTGEAVEQYSDPRGGLILDESYRQTVSSTYTGARLLKSELLILPDEAEGWVQFRDVLTVDGKPVSDRQDRLMRLFSTPTPDPRGQARRIAEEGARYNLTGTVVVRRSLNQPLAPLLYLRAVNQPRSQFTYDGQVVSFKEQQQPTLIGTTGGAGASGMFQIDKTTGQVRRATLRVESRASNIAVTATIRVQYAADTKTGLVLPVWMDETYEVRDPRGNILDMITGEARYSNPRQFKVTTAEVK